MQRSTITLLLLLASFFLSSCGDDGQDAPAEKTQEEIALEKLTAGSRITWTVSNGGLVTKDDLPVTADYSGFELLLISRSTNRTYTTTANPLFDQSGNWSFVGGNFDKIQLTGSQPAAGKEISFTGDGETLTLIFTVPLPANARVSALAGTYKFVLVKERE